MLCWCVLIELYNNQKKLDVTGFLPGKKTNLDPSQGRDQKLSSNSELRL
jgi:hypothetical protein